VGERKIVVALGNLVRKEMLGTDVTEIGYPDK
jgi:hypothetical protein